MVWLSLSCKIFAILAIYGGLVLTLERRVGARQAGLERARQGEGQQALGKNRRSGKVA